MKADGVRRAAAPLVAALLIAPFAVLAFIAMKDPVSDVDVWWVAAVGRDLLHAGIFPRENRYAFTEPHHPWVMHEWLLSIPYGLGIALGPVWFKLISLVTAAFTYCCFIFETTWRRRQPLIGLLLAAVLWGSRIPIFFPRPTFQALIFPTAMILVAFDPIFTRKRLCLAVLIELLWANAHGSFPLGIVFLAAGAFDYRENAGRLRAIAVVLATLATLCTPYGLALHRLVGGYVHGGRNIYGVIQRQILEFTPLAGFKLDFGKVAVIVLIILAVSHCIVQRRDLGRALLVLGLVLLSTRTARNMTLAIIAGLMLLAVPLEDTIPKRWRDGRLPGVARRWFTAGLGLTTAILALIALRPSWRSRQLDASRQELIKVVDRLPAGTRLYAPFGVAALAFWQGAPRDIGVFYDSRNDCYSPELAETFFTLETRARAGVSRLALDQYGTEEVLIDPAHRLNGALKGVAGWRSQQSGSSKWNLYVRDRQVREPKAPIPLLMVEDRPKPDESSLRLGLYEDGTVLFADPSRKNGLLEAHLDPAALKQLVDSLPLDSVNGGVFYDRVACDSAARHIITSFLRPHGIVAASHPVCDQPPVGPPWFAQIWKRAGEIRPPGAHPFSPGARPMVLP